MTNPDTPGGFGPGLSRQTYLDQLADTGHTGWHDEHGVPRALARGLLQPRQRMATHDRRRHHQHRP
ncbi:hypothetical protein [Mycobacterium riyadhense]|uniref:hypothetical protein n=1 Tax=Mycobacterium riyadhense TaxID=486698 RepID=UPI00195C768D|nr:hypothetical protein [Mycobacterium riyadhense]